VARRIGILTGGGDAPGLNGIIESSARVLLQHGVEVIGIRDGFEGVFTSRTINLTMDVIQGAHAQSGTLLGSSNKSGTEGREKEFHEKFKALELDGLIACGGDGTFSGLYRVHDGIKIIGVPKTIDNDLAGTEATFGFDTACACVAENVDALRFTADAHSRLMVVETMGRTAGWIALGGGLASYADAILIPERPFDRGKLVEHVMKIKKTGRREMMIVISEGAMAAGENPNVAFEVAGSPQKERFGGIAFHVSRWLEQETGWESRHVVLGHLQRARHPTTTDRFLTSFMGVAAAKLALANQWGTAVTYREGRIKPAPITDLMQPARLVEPDHRWVQQAQALGIFI
jgi:ATP-dependent phosphofructokinase / diphosphate-dependent phosphofructokinase